jgi:hypothetical protein
MTYLRPRQNLAELDVHELRVCQPDEDCGRRRDLQSVRLDQELHRSQARIP